MKTLKTLKSFIEQSHVNPSLIRAVVRQLGGWESAQESFADIANHSIDGGFPGFIYYSDTVDFYQRNRKVIIEILENMAFDFGHDSIVALIKTFNCAKDCTETEIGKTLYGNKSQHDTQVANCLAWFGGEEVARSFDDIVNQ